MFDIVDAHTDESVSMSQRNKCLVFLATLLVGFLLTFSLGRIELGNMSPKSSDEGLLVDGIGNEGLPPSNQGEKRLEKDLKPQVWPSAEEAMGAHLPVESVLRATEEQQASPTARIRRKPKGWKDAEWIDSRDRLAADGEAIERVTLIRSSGFKEPIRVVETFRGSGDASAEILLETQAMAASHVLVGIVEGVNDSVVRETIGRLGWDVRPHRTAPDLYHVTLSEVALDGVKEAIETLTAMNGLVRYAEPDFVVHRMIEPNDPAFVDGTLWGLDNQGQNNGEAGADIDGPEAWQVRRNASEVIVAVIDTGVRYTHEDLRGNMWINRGEIPGDGIDNDGNGFVDDVYGVNVREDAVAEGDPMDEEGHGTHCAGTIGAVGNNGVGLVGVAWNVQIMGCKYLGADGTGFTSDAIICVDYAVNNGAQVINASYGGDHFLRSALDAYQRARDAGVIVVAAAGNDGRNTDDEPNYPSSYDVDNIVSVANHNRNDVLSRSSNYGAGSVDIAAPGSEIYSSVASADDAYDSSSGTSMAAPHVAGAIAVLKSEFPNESYLETINRVFSSATKVGSYRGRVRTGARLNLAAALGLESVSPILPPEITRSLAVGLPARRVFDLGERLVLSVLVEGEGPLSYEWTRNRQPIPGANGPSLELSSLSQTDDGEYSVEVSNVGGSTTSTVRIHVRVPMPELGEALDAPSLVWFSPSRPAWRSQNLVSRDGSDAAVVSDLSDGVQSGMETSVAGPGQLSFWWKVSTEQNYDFLKFYVDGEEVEVITGQTTWRQVTVPLLVEGHRYLLRWVYEKDGSDVLQVGENSAWVDEVQFQTDTGVAPRFTSQPESITVASGEDALFAVDVEGSTPLAYQWTRDGNAIDGATDRRLVLRRVTTADEGRYAVEVSNAEGSITSQAASLRVSLVSPSIVIQPQSVTLDSGDSFTLSVMASGTAPLVYQWSKDGQIIEDAQEASLTVLRATIADRGDYSVTVSNAAGQVTSVIATVFVNEIDLSPFVEKSPVSLVVTEGEAAQFLVEGGGLGPFTYQWYKDEAVLNGEVEPVLDLVDVRAGQAGEYYAVVSNPFGSVTSKVAVLTVRTGGQELAEGVDNSVFDWTTYGDAEWSYQTSIAADGVDSLQSGEIGDDGFSVLETEVVGPGTLSFDWRVSSEESYDFLGIFVDEQFIDEITGELEWKTYSLLLGEGSHVVSWVYSKDETVASGEDAGWIDRVSFVSADRSPPLIGRQPISRGVLSGERAEFRVELLGGLDAQLQWFHQGAPIPGATDAVFILDAVGEQDGGDYVLVATNEFGTVSSRPARLVVIASDDLIGAALDYESVTWGNDPNSPWSLDLLNSTDGVDSLVLTAVDDDEWESSFGTAIEGPAIVQFNWRIASDTSMEFSVNDDVVKEVFGSLRDPDEWSKVVVSLPEGVHTLNWSVSRYAWAAGDRAWVDSVDVLNAELDYNGALETEGLEYDFSGSGLWAEVVDVFAVSGTALLASGIADGEEMVLETTVNVTEPTTLVFDWRIFTEFDGGVYSRFNFYLGGDLYAQIEGGASREIFDGVDVLTPYYRQVVPLALGENVLRWEYEKRFSIVGGGGGGLLDNLYITELDPDLGPRVGESAGISDENWAVVDSGIDQPWSVGTSSVLEGETSAEVGSDRGGVATLWRPVHGVALSFDWKAILGSEDDRIALEYFTDTESAFDPPVASLFELNTTSDWANERVIISESPKVLRWIFERRGELGFESRAWLDGVSEMPYSPVISEVLDTEQRDWRAVGEGGWFIRQDIEDERIDYLVSTPMVDEQEARLETTVQGPAQLLFDWFASTFHEDGPFDASFRFYLDDQEIDSISGEIDWETRAVEIPEGEHTVAWSYKRGFLSGGRDLVGLDKVRLGGAGFVNGPVIELKSDGEGYYLEWEDGTGEYQLEQSGSLGGNAFWRAVEGVSVEGPIRAYRFPVNLESGFFRLGTVE